MIAEHDRIVLTADIPEQALRVGDVGTVVHIYGSAQAYEVEFTLLDGSTAAVATVRADNLRPIAHSDLTHARPMAEAA